MLAEAACPPPFRLNPTLPVRDLRDRYRRFRRVRIADLLAPEDARRLRDHLAGRQDWRQILNSGEKVFELDRPTRAAMSVAQRKALDEAVSAGARGGFQYRYEALRVPDNAAARAATEGLLAAFVTWLSGGAALSLLRTITGANDMIFADGQATAYEPGDFLTAHDDDVFGKERRAAYVFGLTPQWRPEWGGLLLFHSGDGVEGVAPAFNTLDLFAVPQSHSVSMVTGAAPSRRYAVTGWLRAQPQPG